MYFREQTNLTSELFSRLHLSLYKGWTWELEADLFLRPVSTAHGSLHTHMFIWQFRISVRLNQLAEHVTKNTQRQHPQDINTKSFKQLCQRVMGRSRRKGASEHSQDLFRRVS